MSTEKIEVLGLRGWMDRPQVVQVVELDRGQMADLSVVRWPKVACQEEPTMVNDRVDL